MVGDVVIGAMTRDSILWRCLHAGPLSKDTIDRWAPEDKMPWAQLRTRNIPLLEKLTQVYGASAIVAYDGHQIVGQLRFYPKAVCSMAVAGQLCLQQVHPAGPTDDFAESDFPTPDEIQDRTLVVHCLMTGSPKQKKNPYLRKGIGTRMARRLIEWAKENRWQAIEADAYEDLGILYAHTGQAGRRFWESMGFRVVTTGIEEAFLQENDFVRQMREQALENGIDPGSISNKYTMRIEIA